MEVIEILIGWSVGTEIDDCAKYREQGLRWSLRVRFVEAVTAAAGAGAVD